MSLAELEIKMRYNEIHVFGRKMQIADILKLIILQVFVAVKIYNCYNVTWRALCGLLQEKCVDDNLRR
ncbi:hypothetical protein SAMN02746098_00919 [Desulfosporosinus lacus DSM 15449]|uniref:Uncharacterized protein n=1 Tax=Desulfosporosinus lacus DSM 15449 TaxID=1121420 RepID=A0A1M5UE21_9FIRM|nr:hypothetical protein SAMN02746098_00919 [Desulfosporosinus lacus DSM 15449]